MTCPKCQGLLVIERSLEFYARRDVWRCINCGAIPSVRPSVLPDLHAPVHQRRRARTIPIAAESEGRRRAQRDNVG